MDPQEELAALSARARDAGLAPDAVDPRIAAEIPEPWAEAEERPTSNEEEAWSEEEFWARLPPEMNPATAKVTTSAQS